MQIIDKNLKFTGNLINFSQPPKYLILHHEAAPSATVEEIHSYHIRHNGWSGIAYHLYVRKDGNIYRGRPIYKVGGHTKDYNYMSIGICCEGNFETEHMSGRQYAALCDAIAYVQSVYPGIIIKGHREFNATACPGKYFPLQEVKIKMDRIKTIKDVPESLRKETQELIDSGALKGNSNGLDVTLDMLRCLIISKRYADSKK